MSERRLILIEPFYGGSHKQFIDYVLELFKKKGYTCDLCTLPAKKWHWRARTSALYMSKNVRSDVSYNILFCSSVLNLAEFVSLRGEFRDAKKILYFHENQFVYPQQTEKDRDFQYGYNTILSALVADVVVFNSYYNKNTFLDNIDHHLKKQPDFRIKGLKEEIEPKCRVVYFPIQIPQTNVSKCDKDEKVLHIVWPHRWEHDKDPQLFFETLNKLKEKNLNFRVSILGQSFEDTATIFEKAKNDLTDNIINFGRIESKNEYFDCLRTAHVAVSTAKHEFFGVAMLEAVLCGCYPLAPSSLVYPELYPAECLYKTPNQLFKILANFCAKPHLVNVRLKALDLDLERFSLDKINSELENLIRS